LMPGFNSLNLASDRPLLDQMLQQLSPDLTLYVFKQFEPAKVSTQTVVPIGRLAQLMPGFRTRKVDSASSLFVQMLQHVSPDLTV
jgi:hypothetical protein